MTDRDDELRSIEEAFIEGFRHASDKLGFLRLGHIPLELPDGGKLVEVVLEEGFEVGVVSPRFAERGLVYHPLPHRLAQTRITLSFIYQSLECRKSCGLAEILVDALERSASKPHRDHGHDHPHDFKSR